jgi:hypothetical protein
MVHHDARVPVLFHLLYYTKRWHDGVDRALGVATGRHTIAEYDPARRRDDRESKRSASARTLPILLHIIQKSVYTTLQNTIQ